MVAPPGRFTELYSTADEDALVGSLADALGEVQLDGLLMTYEEVDGFVSPDVSRAQGSLLVLYAAVRFVRAELLNRPSNTRYEAPGVVADTSYGQNILRDVLADLKAKKKEV